jgi:hypothetical protein
MVPPVRSAGFSLLDLVVLLVLLALLVYLVRLDWRRLPAEPATGAHSATHSSFTSV